MLRVPPVSYTHLFDGSLLIVISVIVLLLTYASLHLQPDQVVQDVYKRQGVLCAPSTTIMAFFSCAMAAISLTGFTRPSTLEILSLIHICAESFMEIYFREALFI